MTGLSSDKQQSNNGGFRKATPAENMKMLKARLSEHLSPAEQRELDEVIAILLPGQPAVRPPIAATGETPRTDALYFPYGRDNTAMHRPEVMVCVEHARQLERELAEVTEQRDEECRRKQANMVALESARSAMAPNGLTAYIDELERRATEQKEWEQHPKCEDNGVGDTMQVIVNELREKFGRTERGANNG